MLSVCCVVEQQCCGAVSGGQWTAVTPERIARQHPVLPAVPAAQVLLSWCETVSNDGCRPLAHACMLMTLAFIDLSWSFAQPLAVATLHVVPSLECNPSWLVTAE